MNAGIHTSGMHVARSVYYIYIYVDTHAQMSVCIYVSMYE